MIKILICEDIERDKLHLHKLLGLTDTLVTC